eukprot:TRINITY_DN9273_c0_g1_i1.p4 TRINITY_DN9273_c0_g1~~TRINITY_DN9273_c0_g1_i1.p4  ORF type:complete len:143 (-),score=1.31 TRINITY_DN9273_c0_g1_i1:443-871(-)
MNKEIFQQLIPSEQEENIECQQKFITEDQEVLIVFSHQSQSINQKQTYNRIRNLLESTNKTKPETPTQSLHQFANSLESYGGSGTPFLSQNSLFQSEKHELIYANHLQVMKCSKGLANRVDQHILQKQGFLKKTSSKRFVLK